MRGGLVFVEKLPKDANGKLMCNVEKLGKDVEGFEEAFVKAQPKVKVNYFRF